MNNTSLLKIDSTMSTVTSINRYERRKEKTRQELLVAAKQVLAEKGYHSTKIADIARIADIGVGTFYLYYPTKETLFLELVEETSRLLKHEIDSARATVESPSEKIRVANRTFFRFARENRELFKIVFGHGNTFNELLHQVYALFISDAAERFSEGRAEGTFRPLPPQVVANALVGMSAQVVSWWIEQETLSAEETAEAMTDFILYGLVQ